MSGDRSLFGLNWCHCHGENDNHVVRVNKLSASNFKRKCWQMVWHWESNANVDVKLLLAHPRTSSWWRPCQAVTSPDLLLWSHHNYYNYHRALPVEHEKYVIWGELAKMMSHTDGLPLVKVIILTQTMIFPKPNKLLKFYHGANDWSSWEDSRKSLEEKENSHINIIPALYFSFSVFICSTGLWHKC